MISETTKRIVRKIIDPHLSARDSMNHRKYRRWINLVVRLTRREVKLRGTTVGDLSTHRRQMKKLYNLKGKK